MQARLEQMPNRLKKWHQALCRLSGVDIQRALGFRRLRARTVSPRQVFVRLRNGLELDIEPTQYISRKLLRYGAFDPVVAETVVRLSAPGGLHLDVGANVGYVTALMAARAAPGGRVIAFEPAGRAFSRLRENADRFHLELGSTIVEPRQEAVGREKGHACLVMPGDMSQCDGLVALEQREDSTSGSRVDVVRLDDVLARSDRVVVAKLDVEGGELGVLEGAQDSIAKGLLPNIVFEEHGAFPGPAARFLLARRYSIWRLSQRGPLGSLGLKLADPQRPIEKVPAGFEPDPNYVATLDERGLRRRIRGFAWTCV